MQWFRRKSDDEPAAADAPSGGSGASDVSDAVVRPADAGPALVPAASSSQAAPASPPAVDGEQLHAQIIEMLRTVYDPEIPVNVYEIGLVYGIDIAAGGKVHIRMTLTSPMCPVAESLPIEVENKVAGIRGVTDVSLELVWDPPWTPAMMSEEARLLLNIG
jgi:FeS assembly SUF system protein